MEELIQNIKHYLTINHLFAGLLLVAIVAVSMQIITPRVIVVARKKKLIIPICSRSSHNKEVPSLGGVSFFIIYLISIPIINMIHFGSFAGYNIIGAVTIMFMVGLKDDLVNSSAKVKLYGQFLASFFIALSPDFIISNYHGFLGIYEVNPLISMLVSIIFLVFFINSFNLIDGLDGLASVIGIIITSTFLVMFMLKNDYFFMALSVVTITMLLSFLRFNLSKGRMKMFMGDSGSLIIGMIIGMLALRYLASPPLPLDKQLFIPENRIIFVLCILFIPLLDTFRVIVIRLSKGQSPLTADRNHLHHLLLDRLKTHFLVAITLGAINLAVILIFVTVSRNNSIYIVSLTMFLTTFIILLIAYFASTKRKIEKAASKKKVKGSDIKRNNFFSGNEIL